MAKPKLPAPGADDFLRADWMESYALISPDGNSSYLDLERIVRREGTITEDHDDAIETELNAVAFEHQRRANAAPTGYPFVTEKLGIRVRGNPDDYVAYKFCLGLSRIDNDAILNRTPFPRRLFEDLCCQVAGNYVEGEVVRFASPRHGDDIPIGFGEAVEALSARLGEGGGYKPKRRHSSKDDRLDVVAWRHFPDNREGKLLLMGNCASGRGWSDKLDELQPDNFYHDWMSDYPSSARNAIRAIFLPRSLSQDEWQQASSRGGMVFDRCRIASYVQDESKLRSRKEIIAWTKNQLGK